MRRAGHIDAAVTRRSGDRREGGFTLIEVTVVVAILALVAAVVVPSLAGIGRAELRRTSAQVAGTIRSTYDDAALTGATYRLVFPLRPKDKKTDDEGGAATTGIRIERTAEPFAFDPEALGKTITEPEKKPEASLSVLGLTIPLNLEAAGDAPEEGGAPNPLAALLGGGGLGGSSSPTGESFAPEGQPLQLPESVHLLDVWVEGMDAPETEGEAYLYFFPSGLTQRALIHLEDEDERVFTVGVEPVTGAVTIEDRYVEVEK